MADPRILTTIALDDCWNRIGVQGDRSCERLDDAVHCRNCPVYERAAIALLDRPRVDMPDVAVTANTRGPAPTASAAANGASATDISTPHASTTWSGSDTSATHTGAPQVLESILVFRLGDEWLGLPTTALRQVAPSRPVHRIPHRKHPALLGVVNIQGTLRLCIALSTLLGVESSPGAAKSTGRERLLVIDGTMNIARDATSANGQSHGQGHHAFEPVVIPVDEVDAVHRVPVSAREAVPATVAGKALSHAHAVLRIRDRTVGLLNERVVFETLERSLR